MPFWMLLEAVFPGLKRTVTVEIGDRRLHLAGPRMPGHVGRDVAVRFAEPDAGLLDVEIRIAGLPFFASARTDQVGYDLIDAWWADCEEQHVPTIRLHVGRDVYVLAPAPPPASWNTEASEWRYTTIQQSAAA